MERSYDTVCRACLCNNRKFKYFIHKNVSNHLFSFCTSVEVSNEDQVTKALCNKCYNLLRKLSDFKQSCIDSNTKLMSNSQHSLKTEEYENNKEHSIEIKVKSEEIKLQNEIDADFDTASDDYMFTDPTGKVKPELYQKQSVEANTEKRPKTKKKIRLVLPATKKPKKCMLRCELCSSQYTDTDRYEAHLQWHNGIIVPIECKPCAKTFNTWSGLRRHKESSHSTVKLSSLACHLCGKISKSKAALRSHLNYHTAKTAVCHVCGKEMRQSDMRIHLNTHAANAGMNRARLHECPQCGNRYLNKCTLDKHVRRRHEGRRFICDLCSQSFSEKHALIAHFLRHEGKKIHQCDFCEKSFAARTSLVHHRRLHTGETPYSCTYCTKQFVAKKRLVEHIRTHTAHKPHHCHLCPQMFTQRGTLKRHLKVHEKNAPNPSMLDCGSHA